MASLESLSFITALVALSGTIIMWILHAVSKASETSPYRRNLERFALIAMSLGFLSLTTSISARAVNTGHGPFANMYEFSLAFAWGITGIGLLIWWRYKILIVTGIFNILALGLILFASTLSSQVDSLVPALQQSVLLSCHVAAAVIAYGAFAASFVTTVIYLIQHRSNISRLPSMALLDRISYYAVIIGFPFMTLTIILGAVWADIAWGRYWGWDPKETASLVTWLLYAGYLHARVVRGWKGARAAILLIVGFCAVLFTYFGNYIFEGLHSYL